METTTEKLIEMLENHANAWSLESYARGDDLNPPKPKERAITWEAAQHLRRLVAALSEVTTERDNANAVVRRMRVERRKPLPRKTCPGCFSAIYDGAAAMGWCTDCAPPEALK